MAEPSALGIANLRLWNFARIFDIRSPTSQTFPYGAILLLKSKARERRMFEKNLNELIKGIRAHKGSEAKYIESAVGECKKEIKNKDLEIKAQAILKLTYV